MIYTGKRYTIAQKAHCVGLYKAGLTIREISDIHEISVASIYKWIHDDKIKSAEIYDLTVKNEAEATKLLKVRVSKLEQNINKVAEAFKDIAS